MKKITLLLLVLFFCVVPCYAQEQAQNYYDIFDMQQLEEYGNFRQIFTEAMQGDFTYFKQQLNLKNLFFSEIRDSMSVLKALLIICMLNGIIASLNFGENKTIGNMAFMVSYILTSGLCLKVLKQTLGLLTNFTDVYMALTSTAIPLITAVLVVSGRAALGSLSTVFMYAACNVIAFAINTLILPCISFYAVSGIINCLSPQDMLNRLSKLIYNGIMLGTKALGLIFSLVLTIERAATAGADSMVQKVTVSGVKAVPVVGDVFAVGAEGVISLLTSVKGGFGVALILIMLLTCLVPLVKILVITVVFKVTAALSEPLGDKKISAIIDTAGGVSILAFSVMTCLVIVFSGAVAILLFSLGG